MIDFKTMPDFQIDLAAGGSFDLRTGPALGDGWIRAFAQMGGGFANVTVGASTVPNLRPGWIQIQSDDRTIINNGGSPATVVMWIKRS